MGVQIGVSKLDGRQRRRYLLRQPQPVNLNTPQSAAQLAILTAVYI